MKVAVLGAGNAGFAFASHLTMLGHEVSLFEHPDFESSIESIQAAGGIDMIGALSGFARINCISTDIKAVVKKAEIVIIPVPAYAQEAMFTAYLTAFEEGQIVIFFPGNYAALRFYPILVQRNLEEKILLMEADSIPYGARKTDDFQVNFLGLKKLLYVAAMPANRTKEAVVKLNHLYDIFVPASSVLFVSLNNSNFVLHSPTSILNAGWIETTSGEFSFYWEGMTPSVCRVIESADQELAALGSKFHYHLVSQIDFFESYYGLPKKDSLHGMIQSSVAHGVSKAPASLRDRYLSEDIPFGCVPAATLSKQFHLETPTMNAVIHLANILNNENYIESGITPEKLGLEAMSSEAILRYVLSGSKDFKTHSTIQNQKMRNGSRGGGDY